MKRILFVDFESYYSTKDGYGLKEMSVTEYVRDPRYKTHGLAYSWLDCGDTHWISTDHVIHAWIDAIDWSETIVVSHNCKFDGSILSWRYGIDPYMWFDTVALAKAVLGENVSGYGLGNVANYLGLQAKGELKWDGVRVLTPQQEQEMASYCKGDVIICRGIFEKLIGQFPQGQLSSVDWTLRAFIEPRLTLDQETLREGIATEKKRRQAAIEASGIPKEVLASNAQFARLLVARGIEVPTKISGRTNKPIPAFAKTDEGLETIRRAHPCLYEARIASKANLLETRGESLLAVSKSGLFPFDVGFSGAVQTHRYSGGSGAGGNPQNFTRQSFLRQAVCSPAGRSLVVGDFAAIELRILSWLAKEPKLINKLINNEDVYSGFASLFYKRIITKADKTERQFGKCAILGLGYGMGGDKFQATVKNQLRLDISDADAFSTINLYRETYFNVPKLWKMADAALPLIASNMIGSLHFAPFLKVRRNSIILPSGLAIQYPNLRSTITYRRGRPRTEWTYDVYRKKYEAEPTKLYGGKMIENICQALAGELCKEAITRAEGGGLDCVGQVHDEILAVCEEGTEKESVALLKRCMEQSPRWWPEIKLLAEVGYGKNWNDAKH